MKNQKGITLIALIITIIVMLILVGVSVSTALNTGLFKVAQGATKNTGEKRNEELDVANGSVNIDGEGTIDLEAYVQGLKGGEKEYIPTTGNPEDYIGYYADVDGDGTPDGVIYADLVYEFNVKDDLNNYTYNANLNEENLKKYYISETKYPGPFGEEYFLTADNGGTEDRFYVMALEDFKSSGKTEFTWDEKGIRSDATSEKFGKGKENTTEMINLFNEVLDDAERSSTDIWGYLNVDSDWFVPSCGEFFKFASILDVWGDYNDEDYCWGPLYDLSYIYGTSTYLYSEDYNSYGLAEVALDSEYGGYYGLWYGLHLPVPCTELLCYRLSTTF